jgi:RNA polymerase sigma-70 factor (ECF subfamily)
VDWSTPLSLAIGGGPVVVDLKNAVFAPTVPVPVMMPTAAPPGAFEEFFRGAYRNLLTVAMYVGATEGEAEDAVASAMEDVFRRWSEIANPLAYARKATVSNFLKDKGRHGRLIRRVIERGEAAGGYQDPGLTVWEDREWVTQLLKALSPAQREVMAAVLDEFRPAEVAQLLGATPAAVRQNLHAARRRLIQSLTGQGFVGSAGAGHRARARRIDDHR